MQPCLNERHSPQYAGAVFFSSSRASSQPLLSKERELALPSKRAVWVLVTTRTIGVGCSVPAIFKLLVEGPRAELFSFTARLYGPYESATRRPRVVLLCFAATAPLWICRPDWVLFAPVVELRVLGSARVVPVLGARSDEGPTGQTRVQVVEREIPLPAEAVKECRDVGVAVCTEERVHAAQVVLICLNEDKAHAKRLPRHTAQHIRLHALDVDRHQVDWRAAEIQLIQRMQYANARISARLHPTPGNIALDNLARAALSRHGHVGCTAQHAVRDQVARALRH
eukprot:scaffold128894_cov118-Phaeocystis_antarctica.AAC.1